MSLVSFRQRWVGARAPTLSFNCPEPERRGECATLPRQPELLSVEFLYGYVVARPGKLTSKVVSFNFTL